MLSRRTVVVLGLALLGAGWAWGIATEARWLVKLGLRLCLGLTTIPVTYALRLILTDGTTYIFLGLALAIVMAYGPARRWLAEPAAAIWRPRLWLGGATALGILLGLAPLAYPARSERNRYGFFVPFGLSKPPYVLKSDKPAVPDSVITTNSLGYRDKEWSVQPSQGVRRAIVVGDSNVWGYGIPTDADMLHRKLESALNEVDSQKWEVLNIANTPAALWYYVHALIAVGREVRPDLYVMSFLGYYDLEPWEVQRVKFALSSRIVDLLDYYGISHDLMRTGVSIGGEFSQRNALDADTLADMQAIFAQLVAFLEETNGRLVIWEAIDANPFLDKYRTHPLITVLGWTDVSELSDEIRRNAHAGRVPWQSDETLAYKGDGHPTPKANALIARTIARESLSRGLFRSP